MTNFKAWKHALILLSLPLLFVAVLTAIPPTHVFGDTVGTLDKWIYDTTNVISPRAGTAVKVLIGQTSSTSSSLLQVTGNATVDNLTVTGTCTGCSGASGLGDPGANGVVIRTSLNTTTARTITGTTNRLTVTNGDGTAGNPTLDISASYVGQASITTLGTIGTGTWNGTTIAVANGGTGQTSYTNGQLLIGNTTGNTLAKATLTGTTNQITVTNGAGTITLATPQDIATGSSPSFTGLTISGVSGSTQCLHVNSSGVVSGTGADCGAGGSGLTVGTTTITSGTTGRIEYNNGGVLGELATTGSGNVVLATAPTLSNPVVGTQSASDNSTKAASTAYVTTGISNAIAGVNPAVAVQAASAAKLPNSPTYNNGASGIGAFITTLTTNTALVVDGYTPALLDRILVKNEGDSGGLGAAKNGVYYVSQLHGVGLAWILTRAVDYDMPSDMNNTGAIPVVNGTVNTDTSWVQTSQVTTVGTDAVTFTQFSINPTTIQTTTLTNGHIWIGNGSNLAVDNAVSGDITIGNTGITAIGAGKVTNTMLAGSITAAKLVGTDIATVGTITSGTWNGTAIGLTYGGLGGSITASNGGIFYSDGTRGQLLAGTATAGQVLRSGASGAPTWSTATYPATAGTSGNVLTSDGTNWTSAAAGGGGATTKHGSYVGDGTTNRAIAHSLGSNPQFVSIGDSDNANQSAELYGSLLTVWIDSGRGSTTTVTTADTTNFYVSGVQNSNGDHFYWFASN